VSAPEAGDAEASSVARDAVPALPALRLARVDAKTETPRTAAFGGAESSAPDPGAQFGDAAATPGEERLSGGTPLILTQPDFPRRARVKGIEGAVTVEFTVTETGRVSDPRIVSAEPRGTFDRAVLKTVEGWRFEPFRRNGAAVEQNLTRTIEFRLDGLAKTPAQPACVTMTGSRLCRDVRLSPAERDVEILQRANSGQGLGVR
jgi:TonB family protein